METRIFTSDNLLFLNRLIASGAFVSTSQSELVSYAILLNTSHWPSNYASTFSKFKTQSFCVPFRFR